MQEQELFQSYEVKNWDFNPRIYKILAVSAIFNVLALFIVGQTNLLTTKGCDSPLVGGVCQVLDTLYVGGTVLTTDKAMTDDPYDPTNLKNAEIIWFDRTGAEDFKYPEGYFALSNPEMIPQEIPTDPSAAFPNIPGIPNPTTGGGGGNLLDTRQELPQNNPNAVIGPKPDSPFTFEDNPTIPKTNRLRPNRPQKTPKINQESPNKLPDLNSNQTANTDKNPNEDKVSEVVINKKPMKDFASVVKTKYDKKEVDLSQNFTVVADGVLTKDGKLDTTVDKKTNQPKSRVIKAEGNEQMIEVAKQAIAAIGDSGWLVYLRNQGVDKINFTVVQDNDNLQVIIVSDQPTPERAKTMASGLNGVIQAVLLADKNNLKKLGDDERILLSNAKVTDSGKQFVLNFVLAKPVAQEMIMRKLNEPPENSTEPKPNGNTGQIKEDKQNAAK